MSCPTCRREHKIPGNDPNNFPNAFLIEQLQNVVKKLSQQVRKSDVSCHECKRVICEQCYKPKRVRGENPLIQYLCADCAVDVEFICPQCYKRQRIRCENSHIQYLCGDCAVEVKLRLNYFRDCIREEERLLRITRMIEQEKQQTILYQNFMLENKQRYNYKRIKKAVTGVIVGVLLTLIIFYYLNLPNQLLYGFFAH